MAPHWEWALGKLFPHKSMPASLCHRMQLISLSLVSHVWKNTPNTFREREGERSFSEPKKHIHASIQHDTDI